MILAINRKVYGMDIEYEEGELETTILRHKQEMALNVETSPISGAGSSRVVFWGGAILQEPHKAVLQQSKTLPSRIYINARARGSPAYMYNLTPTNWITHINSTKVDTLDDLIDAVKDIPDNSYVRVRCVTFDNILSCFLSK